MGTRVPLLAWVALLALQLAALSSAASGDGGSSQASNLDATAFLARFAEPLRDELFANNLVLVPSASQLESPSGLRALVVFEKPASFVMPLLSQTARQSEHRPELSQLDRISEQGGWFTDEHVIKMLFLKIVYRVRSRVDFQLRRIEWQLDESVGNDLRALNGFWQLYELDRGRTVGHFGSTTEIGNGVPASLGKAITRRKVPGMLENCRRWVNSAGRYRP